MLWNWWHKLTTATWLWEYFPLLCCSLPEFKSICCWRCRFFKILAWQS